MASPDRGGFLGRLPAFDPGQRIARRNYVEQRGAIDRHRAGAAWYKPDDAAPAEMGTLADGYGVTVLDHDFRGHQHQGRAGTID